LVRESCGADDKKIGRRLAAHIDRVAIRRSLDPSEQQRIGSHPAVYVLLRRQRGCLVIDHRPWPVTGAP
jgi:hypothetical protein